MQAHRRHGQAVFLPQAAHLYKVYEVFYVLLHIVQPDKRFKLRHKLVEVRLLRLCGGRLCALRRFLSGGAARDLRVLVLEARLARRDEVHGVQCLLRLAHAARVAYRGKLVRALGDVLRLRKRHIVVTRRDVQQYVREHSYERARGLRAALGVRFGKVPVEHRRHEHLAVAHGARQAPQHPRGLRLVARIYLVCDVHMPLRHSAAAAPQLQGAVGHEFVQLLGQ